MRNFTFRVDKFLIAMLMSNLLFFFPMIVEGKCGPDCNCGCQQGGTCTCSQTKDQAKVQNDQVKVQHDQTKVQQDQVKIQQDQTYNQDDQAYSQYEQSLNLSYNQSYNQYDQNYQYNQPGYQFDYGDCCDEEGQLYYSPAALCRYCYGELDQYGCIRPAHINPGLEMNEPCCKGIWMPEEPPLFRPFMADPRQLTYSVGWRFNDDAATKNVIGVSFADSFPIYRWCGVWPWNGQLQIDLEGGLWAIFDPCYESAPLINADYFVAIPITYAIDRWQFRLRGFHISSHIGDEFLLNHPDFDRRNPSAEYLDFFVSHDLTEEIRLYGGLGWVVAQDPSFKISKFYSGIGAELRLLRWGFLDCKNILYGCPIFGMHFRGGRDFIRHIDATYVLGYEIGKLTGLFRRYRIYMEYHDGYSAEGQFAKIPTHFFSVRMSYGF